MDPSNLNPYMRFATDTLGQELQPQASIWKMYVEEASEQDTELADVQNKNLDLMLLFVSSLVERIQLLRDKLHVYFLVLLRPHCSPLYSRRS
jgi:hypothetical protein